MTLISLSLAWLAGLFWSLHFGWLILLAGLSLSAALLWMGRRRRWPLILGLAILAFLAGSLRAQTSPAELDEHSLAFYNGQVAEIRGVVAEAIETRAQRSDLRLEAREIKVAEEWRNVSGLVLVQVPPHYSYSYGYGDLLQVRGKLDEPPLGKGFDYRGYLARQGIGSLMRYPRVEWLGSGYGSRILSAIYRLRERLSRSLEQALHQPQASLAQGILLGLRGNIPTDINQAFAHTGTTHILAISGINITIVAGILLSLAIWALGRRGPAYILLSLAVLWLYALLAGGNPPIIRASIMASLFLAADYLGRPRSAGPALALAAAVMAGLQPQVLQDVSFQLSFLSMAGLVYLFPPLQERGRRLPLPTPLCDAIFISLAAILATWPVIAYYFDRVPLVGLPATLLALPALPAIIVTTALVAGLGLFAPSLALVAGVAWLFITYMIKVVEIFALLPLASLPTDSFHTGWLWGYYLALSGAMAAIRYRSRLRGWASWLLSRGTGPVSRMPWKWTLACLFVAAVLVWTAVFTLATLHPGQLRVSFLDVGQGDAILIQTPSGHQILVDGGPSPQALCLALGREMPFWDKSIDLVIVTHPDLDHWAGLAGIASSYQVGRVWDAGLPSSTSYKEWRGQIARKGIPYRQVRVGWRLTEGEDLILEVLNPPENLLEDRDTSADNNSLVLRLKAGRVSFLLTADIAELAESELVASRAGLEATVLKVAHHGSRTSTSPRFLAAVSPSAAVISVGKNSYGHPSSQVLDRLEERLGGDRVYLTSKRGTIELITDGSRLWVKTER